MASVMMIIAVDSCCVVIVAVVIVYFIYSERPFLSRFPFLSLFCIVSRVFVLFFFPKILFEYFS